MTLAGMAGSRGAAWGDDGTIVIGGIGTGLWRVAASGGQAVPLTKIDRGKGEAGHQWPVLLPGSRTVLFATVGGLPCDFHTIEAVSLETGTRRQVLENADAPVYLPGGYLVFSARGELRVVRFDAARAEVVGESRLATEDISPQLADPGGYFTLSRAGDLAYLPSRSGISGPSSRSTRTVSCSPWHSCPRRWSIT